MRDTYLGDAVYARIEDGMLKLWTEREGVTHYIYLEPEVYMGLVKYAERASEELEFMIATP